MIAELSKYGIDVRPGSRGDVKVICPKCSHTRRNKKDPCLSVNVDTGVWNCHHCDFHGRVKKMKEYNRPTVELKTLGEPVLKWFAARGITNQTLLRYRITDGKEWMPQVEKEVNCIKFVYYDEFNEVANIKFRDRDKNFKMVSGARLLPYGMDVCADNSSDSVVIVEGELDVLAAYEAGIKNAVSVPNGASKGSQKLEWLEECIDFFEGKRIYIATDMDEPGRALKEELARRLGKENCYDVTLPKKDSNEVLMHLGPEVLAQCFREARPFPLDGIEALTTSEMLSLYDEGVPQGCNVGWSNMDEHFKWHTGMVTLITGIPGHGKTTFLKNIITRLASLHHWKFMVYSAEEASAKFAITEIMSIKSGKAFFSSPLAPRLGRDEIAQLTPWIDDHFKYYSLDEQDGSIENIMKAADAMVRVHGINGLIIDNMSTVERGIRGSGDSRHNEIGNMMRDLRSWARKRGVHVFLVAHPKKMSKVNGVYEVPTGYDVGDSSNYYNAPDNGITVYRRGDQTEIHFWKVRFWWSGSLGTDHFKYRMGTSEFYEANQLNDGSNKTYFKNQPITKGDIDKFIGAGAG